MSDRAARVSLSVEGLSTNVHVTSLQGREGLSELFAFEIDIACSDDSLALHDVVGANAALTLEANGARRVVHGIIGRVEQFDDVDDLTRYAVTLVPEVKRLELRQDCRVFAEATVPNVVRAVLDEANITDYRFDLRLSYPVLEHCIQYRESDWAFISRLLEAEGIFYYFEQQDRGAVLVFGDGRHAHAVLEPEPVPAGRNANAGEQVSRFRFSEELRPDRVALRGQSFKNPTRSLEAGAEAKGGRHIEVYDDFAESDATAQPDPQLAERRARQRLEQLQVDRVTAHAMANTPRLAAGYVFSLVDHPRPSFNQSYLLRHVTHRASQPLPGQASEQSSYSVDFACIPAEVPFRPALATPRPRSQGSQTAVVVGPRGEEIYTDELGRIRVQFQWDRRGKLDERSSCWIRVAQLWAGSGFGSMHIPRVGQEVLVDFLGGDVDRPIVVGGLYHATNVMPYALPAGRTISTWRSRSTPAAADGNAGSNEIRFEDASGLEEVYLHAERDMNVAVEQDRRTSVGNDDDLAVEGNRTKRVGADDSEVVGASKTIGVGSSHDETIGSTQTISVGSDSTHKVGGNRNANVEGNVTEVVGQSLSLNVGSTKNERVEGASAESIGGDKSSTIDGNLMVRTGAGMAVAVGASSSEEVEEEKTVIVGTRMHFVCGAGRITVEKNGAIVIQGTDIEIRSDNPLKLSGKTLSVRSSGAVNVRADGAVKVKGSRVNMN